MQIKVTKHVIKVSDLVTCIVWQDNTSMILRVHFLADDGKGCPVSTEMNSSSLAALPPFNVTDEEHLNLMDNWASHQNRGTERAPLLISVQPKPAG